MDRGLTRAVDSFARAIGEALNEAASPTTVRGSAEFHRDALIEAFNLCTALIDCDGRHSDDELWALVAAFSRHDILHGMVTPDAVRRNDLIKGKRAWLNQPSKLFDTLRRVDQVQGTTLSRTYFEHATQLAYVVASLDQQPSEAELKAILAYQRLLTEATPISGPKTAEAGTGKSVDEEPAAADEPVGEPEPLEDLLAELDGLIGLTQVKEEVKLLTALLRVQKLRQERGLPVVDANNHLIFSGNPGTGKTTVGRLLARIYRSLGVIEKGQLVEVDRSGLVAGFVGQTADKVNKVFDRAEGGFLLIDEAYSLTRGGEKDFGREAIDAVVKNVEDRRDSMVVVLAGYPDEMAELVASNPGFGSRFPKTVYFPDYNDDELVAILKLITEKGGYALTDEAVEAAKAWFMAHPRGHGFGNGRLARNLFEAAVARQAQRLIDIAEPTDEELTNLEAADVASVPTGSERQAALGNDQGEGQRQRSEDE